MIKCAALALCACAVCLLIKRSNPELSLALSAATALMIALAAFRLGECVNELAATVKTIIGTANTTVAPVLKCVAIAAVTKISGELCRDAAQSAMAATVELAGTMCAIAVAMPMVISMLKLIGGMI